MKKTAAFSSGKLNYLELGVITGLALGLPAMVIGGKLAREIGPTAAFTSVCIGNFILWMIGMGIISMTQGNENAIQNIKDHLGKYTANFSAFILSFAFLGWYTIQINGALEGVGPAFEQALPWYYGVVLGLIVTILSLGGLRFIRGVSLLCFPILVILALYFVFFVENWPPFQDIWVVSTHGILTILLMWLPGIVNLPTFFRHSRSQSDSVLGLSLLTFLHSFFQIFTIFTNIDTPLAFLTKVPAGSINLFLGVSFAIISFLCINLVNVYFATAAWETLFPKNLNYKGFLTLGLSGTLTYILLSGFTFTYAIAFPVDFLETVLASFIASLGIILVLDFMCRALIKHRDKKFAKIRGSICWMIGCIASVINQLLITSDSANSLLIGMITSFLAFLLAIFIEEAIWSIQVLREPKN